VNYLILRRVSSRFKDYILLLTLTLSIHLFNKYKVKVLQDKEYKVQIKLNKLYGIFLRPYSGDLFVCYEVMMDRAYEIPSKLCKKYNVVIDLGAKY